MQGECALLVAAPQPQLHAAIHLLPRHLIIKCDLGAPPLDTRLGRLVAR